MRTASVAVGAWLLVAAPAGAGLFPTLDVAALVRDADVVVVGSVTSVVPIRTVIVDDTTGVLMSADFTVDQVLKGRVEDSVVRLQYPQPDQVTTSTMFPALPRGDCILFLQARTDHYEFVSRYYPGVLGARGVRLRTQKPLSRVAEVVAAALQQPDNPYGIRSSALHILAATKDPVASQALRSMLRSDDGGLKREAAGVLLRNNDVAALPYVEHWMLEDYDPSLAAANVARSIEGIRDPVGIPSLSRLLGSRSVDARRGAAQALRLMHLPDATWALAPAMDDRDEDVAYYAVMGFAEMTKDHSGFAPSKETFRENPTYYVGYWRAWALSRQP